MTNLISPNTSLDAEQIALLIMQLSSPDSKTRTEARFTLAQIGSPAIEQLTQACHGADSRLRWEVCKTIGLIGDPAAVPALLKALQDNHFEIRWLAAEGLIAIGRKDPEYLKVLLHELLQHPNSMWLREGAHHVFHDLLIYNQRTVFKPLVAALGDLDWTEKAPAAINAVLDELAS